MDRSVTYEKVYFHDDYRQQFEAFRDRYRSRTQKAIGGNKIDHHPVSNISEIVHLHDNGNGGVTVTTTGDFVEFFNHRYGDSDRIGAMRRALAAAEQRAKSDSEQSKRQKVAESISNGFADRIRTTGRRFAFVHAVLALMLVIAAFMVGATSVALKIADANLDDLNAPAAAVKVEETSSEAAEQYTFAE
jgi:hypothetical protein